MAYHTLYSFAEFTESCFSIEVLILLPEKLVVNLLHLSYFLVFYLLLFQIKVIHFGILGLLLRSKDFCHLDFFILAFL